ncbi:spheroidene monooxygenase [Deinococcus budaensis]|uniref:Heme-degrading monooxygenase HmoA n=1 Tax=Deinococcus budaensis TaxID=1665626 RepID=A0A7W8LPQ7_9DEIO|nr:spheroidene monooxygenase [Deinococcus budaensis]MBB5233959.1 heme-degrading monooxygenase HmoA [Deinococcus budaensis]
MSAPAGPVVSLTLNRYGERRAWEGFTRMGRDHLHLRGVPGLRFYRLLGTGRGADLTLGADWRRWARLGVWASRREFERFEESRWRAQERGRVAESYTLLLRPVRWHGRWGGREPFGPALRHTAGEAPDASGPLAVLTRASVRPGQLAAFWRAVPASQAGLRGHPGLLASLGLGETPLLHQVTFSVWRSPADLRAFAYQGAGHREAIARTRREGWYREELFARFTVLAAGGRWDGHDPLQEALAPVPAPAPQP